MCNEPEQIGGKTYFTFESTWLVEEKNDKGEITRGKILEISLMPYLAYTGVTHPRNTMDSVPPCEGDDSGSTPDEDIK